MIKNECEIVKDMLPSYVENTLSSATNEFIETHIKECKNCKKILDELKKEEIVEKNQDKKSKKNKIKDIDYLKKYNRRVKLLTSIVYILIIFIILVLAFYWYIRIKNYNKYNYNYNIILTAYEKYDEIIHSNNFLYEADYGDVRYRPYYYGYEKHMAFYYKDGKFKRIRTDINDGNPERESDEYGKIKNGIYSSITLNYYKDGKISRGLMGNLSTGKLLSDNNYSTYIDYFYNLGIDELINLEITDEIYNGKECYLIKKYDNNNKSQWIEMWIEKDTMLVIREKNNEKDNNWDYNYKWTVGNVTDEDVTITDTTRQDWLPFYNETLDMLLEK